MAIQDPDVAQVGCRELIAIWGKHDGDDSVLVVAKRPCEAFARRDAPNDDRHIPCPADDHSRVRGERQALERSYVYPSALADFIVRCGRPEDDTPGPVAVGGYPAAVVGDGDG